MRTDALHSLPPHPCSQPPARTSPGLSPARSHLSGEAEMCVLVTKSQAREGREWLTELKGVGLRSLGVSTLSTSDGCRRSPVGTGLPGNVRPALQHFAGGWIQAPVRFLISLCRHCFSSALRSRIPLDARVPARKPDVSSMVCNVCSLSGSF